MSADLKTAVSLQFGTPSLVIDLDIVERNIARLQAQMEAAGLNNRPHIKTHKSPELGRLQLAAGASGITCQKLGEAEVFAAAGFNDILISYNVFGEEKEQRAARLLRDHPVDLIIAADNPVTIASMGRAGVAAGRPVGIVIECDTGRKRAGVVSAAEAVQLARRVAETPGVTFRGLMFYPPEHGWAATQAFFDEAKAGLAAHGLSCEIVSTGGSPNLPHVGQLKGATEHRSGTSIFNDRMQIRAGVAELKDCALTVYATVVSRAAPERGILDAGSKTLTTDSGGLEGHGLILEHPEARITNFAEEHGFLDLSACNDRPEVGAVVRVVPNHVCVTVNMVDRLVAVRGAEIVGEVTVEARGKLR
jgi:D-serine deaminase-like pyridoxal phosphate-dependent protein